MMSIIGCLLQRGYYLFYSDCLAAIFSADSGFRFVSLPIQNLLPVPKHLAVYLIFSSLRSIRPGCRMPFDSFMHSGFRFLLCFLLLREKNFCIVGVGTSLLFRSSVASPGPASIPNALFSTLPCITLSRQPHNFVIQANKTK
jgi:hypothetical protein